MEVAQDQKVGMGMGMGIKTVSNPEDPGGLGRPSASAWQSSHLVSPMQREVTSGAQNAI